MRIVKTLIAGAISLGLAYWIWRGTVEDAFVLPWPGDGVASGKLHLYEEAWILFAVGLGLGIVLSLRTGWRLSHSAVGRAHIEGMDWILGSLIVAAVAASVYFGLGG